MFSTDLSTFCEDQEPSPRLALQAFTDADIALSYEKALNFGMPNITIGMCCICGEPFNEWQWHSAHHLTPKGRGQHTINLHGFELRSSVIDVCGSGTTGCHNAFHGGASLKGHWVWDHPEDECDWWNGKLLRLGYEPHDKRLWDMGRYVFTTRIKTANGYVWGKLKEIKYPNRLLYENAPRSGYSGEEGMQPAPQIAVESRETRF